jgi:hypothetical protein
MFILDTLELADMLLKAEVAASVMEMSSGNSCEDYSLLFLVSNLNFED